MGRSPQEIEDQITYPLSLKLQGLAGVKRRCGRLPNSTSSMITLIFEDNVDFYFARQRVLERLTVANTFLPEGVTPYLAPDATALGQIFWYTIEGGDLDPGRRWALQKFYVGPEINSVPGVAEVGSVGGMPARGIRSTWTPTPSAPTASRSASCMRRGRPQQLVRRRPHGREESRPSIWWRRRLDQGRRGHREHGHYRTRRHAGVRQEPASDGPTRPAVFAAASTRRTATKPSAARGPHAASVGTRWPSPSASRTRFRTSRSALPAGVHIVPAYDRTRLIHGAIVTLTGVSWFNVPVAVDLLHAAAALGRRGVMWHEMIIAAAAIMLILLHFRSALRHLRDAAAGGSVRLPDDVALARAAYPGRAGQHHVDGRHHHFHRHPRGPGHRHGRKRHAPAQGPVRR